MSELKKEKSPWRNRLKHKYRFVLRDEDDHEIVSTFSFKVYAGLSTLMLFALFVYFFGFITSFFQPIRHYFRTQEEIEFEEMMNLRDRLKEMELIVEAQSRYNEAVRKLLTGQGEESSKPADSQTSALPLSREIRSAPAREGVGRTIAQLYLLAPLIGKITAAFNEAEGHWGVDIVAPKNSAILSITDGYVLYADWSLETGNTLLIQHEDNLVSVYKHNSMLLKKIGDFVKAGEAIAIIGNTGSLSTGPHLHFELWHEGRPVDPLNYIKF
jgi:murein DD-endopeptidase MepM/ murein hydrolase activator NlpD